MVWENFREKTPTIKIEESAVLVTGANRGIGEVFVAELLRAGIEHVIT